MEVLKIIRKYDRPIQRADFKKLYSCFLLGCLVFFVVSLGACAKYAIRKSEIPRNLPRKIELSASLDQVKNALGSYLSKRGQKYKIYRNKQGTVLDFEMEWVRDSDLAYFYVQTGRRIPHLSHWKGVWQIQQKSKNTTLVILEIMELIYLGPREEAPARPNVDGQWAESSDSNLRAALELKRFSTERFPRIKLPTSLAKLKAPDLDFPPLSLKKMRPDKLYRSSKTTAF